MTSRRTLLLALLLGLITGMLFSPALRYQYIHIDDFQYTIESPRIVSGLSMDNFHWAFLTIHESWYSPLLWISFMADSSLFGPGAFGYHLTNLLLHMANALLLFWILVRLNRAPLAAFFAAALWSLHPLRIESVVWIAERKDVLSGFFFLLALWAYLRYVERPDRTRSWMVFLGMACGMLSKTILVVLPPILLLLDVWPLRRISFPASVGDLRRWRPLLLEKAPLFILMAAGICLTLYTHRHAHDNAPPLSVAARLALIAPAYWGHLKQILWPGHLALFYPVSYPSAAVCALAWIALLLLLLAAWRQRDARPGLLVGALWFLVAFAPVIRGIRFDEQSAYPDRYSYLPAIGLSFLFIGLFIPFVSRSRRRLVLASLLALALLAALAYRGLRYLPRWESQDVMAPVLIRQAPDNPLVNNMYGQLLANRNQYDEAIPCFKKATRWNVQASCNLATALLHAGRPEEALPIAAGICAESQVPPDAFLTLGVSYLQLDQATSAIPPLQRATQLLPAFPLAWQLLYRARLESGDAEGARACLRQLRQMNATEVLDFSGLVRLYTRLWQEGDPRLAWPFFANNFRRHPQNILLHNNAAWLLATTATPPAPASEALRLAQATLDLAGDSQPNILDTLAAAYAANGDFDHAVQTARRALGLLDNPAPGAQALRRQIQRRLDLYRQHQPYREPAP